MPPGPDDMLVCAGCSAPLQLRGGELRAIAPDEIAALPADEQRQLRIVQRATTMARIEAGGNPRERSGRA